jgi:hypothetical protein
MNQVDAVVKLNGKKGIGFTLREIGQPGSWGEKLPKVIMLDVDWNYSWGTTRPDLQPDSIDFLPMIWGYWNNSNVLQQNVNNILTYQKPKMLLGFNEPDKRDQANMSVEQALRAWPILESANVPLVSPSCAYPLGSWMRTFMERANELQYRVDIVGVHFYGGPNPRAFQGLLTSIYETYQKPILVTEFAPADWQAQSPEENRYSPQAVLDFMKAVLPWMESQDWIVGYAWFSFDITRKVGTSSALFDEGGQLTALGTYYANWNGTQGNAGEWNETQNDGDWNETESSDWNDLLRVPWLESQSVHNGNGLENTGANETETVTVNGTQSIGGNDTSNTYYENEIRSSDNVPLVPSPSRKSPDWNELSSSDWNNEIGGADDDGNEIPIVDDWRDTQRALIGMEDKALDGFEKGSTARFAATSARLRFRLL